MANPDEPHDVDLEKAVGFTLEEGRMILPGIQALFGFQLVAVFDNRFAELFDELHQWLHVSALVLVALACALAMTPAAYHRQAGVRRVSPKLLKISSRMIGAAMVPLMVAISIDVGLCGYAVTESDTTGLVLGVSCLVMFTLLWVVFPRVARHVPRE